MTRVLYQKGANGLVAEHRCAQVLNAALHHAGFSIATPQDNLDRGLSNAMLRVANDLSDAQMRRAFKQGDALGEYIARAIMERPSALGVEVEAEELRSARVEVLPIGSATNSGSSADLLVKFRTGLLELVLPISLKAYRGSVSSLGSKGARASLVRLFLEDARVSDEDFASHFGDPAHRFLELMQDFREVTREFYSSPEGEAFIDLYEARKGTRKVNNPARRKELGDYYVVKRGFKTEHLLAELFVQMFQVGMAKMARADERQWDRFIRGMKFLLGMDDDVLTLNAIADDDGRVVRVSNSLEEDAWSNIRRVLVPGCEVSLEHRADSSIVRVVLSHQGLRVRCLQLAVWKDATVQFKLDSSIVT